MNDIIFNTLKQKDFIIKNYLIKIVKDSNLSLNDFLLLIYFYNQEEPTLDMDKIKLSIDLKEEEIMESFSRLNEEKLIDITIMRDSKGVSKEIISLDNLIKKATSNISEKCKTKEDNSVFSRFEEEFGRTLSRTEYEIINEWIESSISNELILEALRLAVYNGSVNFRYISAVLNDWKKQGYKSKDDVSVGLKEKSDTNVLSDLLDSNWIDEN